MEIDESSLVIHHNRDELLEPHGQENDEVTGGSPDGLAAVLAGSLPTVSAVSAVQVLVPSGEGGFGGQNTAGAMPAEVEAEIPSWVPLRTNKFVKKHIPRCMLTVGKKS